MSGLNMSTRGDLTHFVTSLGVRDARTVDKLMYLVEQIAADAWDEGYRAAARQSLTFNPYREGGGSE